MGIGYTWIRGLEFPTWGTGVQDWRVQCLKVQLSDLISIWQGLCLKISLSHYIIQIKSMFNILTGSSTCIKWKKYEKLTWLKNLVHRGLIYWKKYDGKQYTTLFRSYLKVIPWIWHSTYAAFQNYSWEEVRRMMKLDIFSFIPCWLSKRVTH